MAPYRERHGDAAAAAAVALLTGAVDENLVSGFLSLGYRLLIAGKLCEVKPVAERFSDAPLEIIEMDLLSGEEEMDAAVHKAWNVHKRLDVLVFITSFDGPLAPVLELSELDWDKCVTSNLKAAWMLGKCAAARMRDQAPPGGSIVFVTSIAGSERGLVPGAGAHGTCMAAIHHLTKAMALEVGKYNIRVNAVVRGFSESDRLLQSLKDPQRYAKLLPLQRWEQGTGGFVPVVLFLAGSGSSFMTGTSFLVDGGQSIVRPRLRAKL